jgi:hypothetical protein
LNTTAARIWDLVSDGRGRSEIQRLVSQEFDVPEMLAAAQIEELLDSLLSENIITAQVDEQSD